MRELVDRIRAEGVHVGGGIVKVDGFLNHQVDAGLMTRIGQCFAEHFDPEATGSITRVITAEVSGIAPGLQTAAALEVPLVFARKHRSRVMTDEYYFAPATSRTKDEDVNLMISRSYLVPSDRVLVIDDFLATGSSAAALATLVQASGATLCGIGCVIEKPAEEGRSLLETFGVPVVSLATVDLVNDAVIVG